MSTQLAGFTNRHADMPGVVGANASISGMLRLHPRSQVIEQRIQLYRYQMKVRVTRLQAGKRRLEQRIVSLADRGGVGIAGIARNFAKIGQVQDHDIPATKAIQSDDRILDIANDISGVHGHIGWIVAIVVGARRDGIERVCRRFLSPKRQSKQLDLAFQSRCPESTRCLIEKRRARSAERETDCACLGDERGL